MRIAVCNTQHISVNGGGERHGVALVSALRDAGHEAELITIPRRGSTLPEVITEALTWRLVDLTESNGIPIDGVIALRFPAYLVRHPRKVIWLLHQMREVYELLGGPFGHPANDEGIELHRRVHDLDARAFDEAVAILTNSRVVSDRLRASHGIDAPHLYHPAPSIEPRPADSSGEHLLAPGRVESIKRQDLLLRALALTTTRPRCIVTGEGTRRPSFEALARDLGIDDRVEFRGHVPREELVSLFHGARAVYSGGYEEDFGYVAIEAMSGGAPVVTLSDAGETLEFVQHGVTGLIAEPTPEALAASIDELWADPAGATRMGANGPEVIEGLGLSWDRVATTLVEALS